VPVCLSLCGCLAWAPNEIVRDAVAREAAEPTAVATTTATTAPSASPSDAAPEPAPESPDVGPHDRLGERPKLIRDASREGRVELAKKLVNPISDLIRVPIEFNYDEAFGPADAHRFSWTVSPLVPFRLSEDLNLIARLGVPIVSQQSPIPGGDDMFGLGDINASLLLAPQGRRWIWGVGPVLVFPTATDEFLGFQKWGAGPNAIAVAQEGPWTTGVVASQVWSFAGDHDRRNLNVTSVLPFVAYTTENAFTLLLQVDAKYDWDAPQDHWLVPGELTLSKVRRLGRNLVNVGVTGRYYAESPENGPEWGVSLNVTFLFRK
jgi:hypothetical protein